MKPVFALVTYRGAEKFSDNQRKRADNSYEDRKHKGDPYGSRLFSLGMSRAIHEEPSNRTQHLAISYDIYKYGFYRAPVLLDYGAFALVTHSPGRNPRNLPGLFLFTSAYSQSERDCLADAALGLIENSANLSLFRSPFGRGARSERTFFEENWDSLANRDQRLRIGVGVGCRDDINDVRSERDLSDIHESPGGGRPDQSSQSQSLSPIIRMECSN